MTLPEITIWLFTNQIKAKDTKKPIRKSGIGKNDTLYEDGILPIYQRAYSIRTRIKTNLK